MITDLNEIEDFLPCQTPQRWVECAIQNQSLLLIDHANCEKKAAGTALNLMFRYVDNTVLCTQLSKLAREELRHFEQVLGFIERKGITYQHIPPGRYASTLHDKVRKNEPYRLIDSLLVGSIIEARSCERFSRLIEILDDELASFYNSLLKSESRHAGVYLEYAKRYGGTDFDERLNLFLAIDQKMIESSDNLFRFHSGIPTESVTFTGG